MAALFCWATGSGAPTLMKIVHFLCIRSPSSREPKVKQDLTPKQVARALGVSESSLKRWCDQGRVPCVRTQGGHRRLLLDDVLEFVRRSGHTVVRPEALGIPPRSGSGPRTMQAAQADLYEVLVAGKEGAVRQILFDLFLAGIPLSRVFDEVVAPAFRRIGQAWACGEAEVYQERRAVEVSLRVIFELRDAIGPPPERAPLAIGGAPPPDPYSLATTMVELVLRQNGWNAQSLGSRLPFATLSAAIRHLRPQLFWLSVSHLEDEAAFLKEYREFFDEVRNDVLVVVGGQALHDHLRRQMPFSAHCDNLQHLENFAAALKPLLDSKDPPATP